MKQEEKKPKQEVEKEKIEKEVEKTDEKETEKPIKTLEEKTEEGKAEKKVEKTDEKETEKTQEVSENKDAEQEKKEEPVEEERRFSRKKRKTKQEMDEEKIEDALAVWKPKTKVGELVRDKKIKDIDVILKDYKILESEIVDTLLKTESDLLNIGQSKGKFGGGKRRAWKQTQKKTSEGNVPTFSCFAVVGDKNSHVGVGRGRAKETLPAREKASRRAKINLMKVNRGCGSFDCACSEEHSIPFKVEGKCGSVRVILIPAPQGTGLVIGDECKKILKLAGIKDIYSQTYGHKRTTFNIAKACVEALKKTNIGEEDDSSN
jgi:small subunit ribosomal protein S5